MTAPVPNRPHYPALDGLRGIAILLVVLFHNFGFVEYFTFGWLGVDLFFVLSGFLITNILLNSLSQPYYLKNFYKRRILRIFPLYYLVLVIALWILPWTVPVGETFHFYRDNQVWLWTFTQNWLYATKDIGDSNILFHLWSLAAEEQFYLIWPLIILLVRNYKWLTGLCFIFLGCMIFARIRIWHEHLPGFNYFSLYTFTRMDGLFIGSALALVRKIGPDLISRHTALIISGIAGINFLFFFINRAKEFSYPYFPIVGYSTVAVVFAVIVNEAVSDSTKQVVRILRIPVLRFFGKISYGFYLIHWPLHRLLAPLLHNRLANLTGYANSSLLLITSLLTTGLAVALSVLSYRYFESYFLKLKDKWTR